MASAPSSRLPPGYWRTLARHVAVLRLVGLDVLAGGGRAVSARAGLFAALFLPAVAGQLLYAARGASLPDVANALPTTLMALQDAVKMIVIYLKLKEIKHVITGIGAMWPTRVAPRQNTSFTRWLRRSKAADDTFFTCSVLFITIYELAPLLATARRLRSAPLSPAPSPSPSPYLYPLQCYFMRWLTAPWQYALGYLYLLTTSVTAHMSLYVSADFLLITLTVNLSVLMLLLQGELEDAVSAYDPRVERSVQHVKHVVATHQKLLRLAEELSDIFSLLVFVQVSFSSVVICCFGFLAVVAEGMLLSNLVAALGVVFAVCNLCWPGQLLADTSFGVSEAAYGSEWCDKDVALRRYILIIMTRAQRPCHLTALGFSNLQLANFAKILSTSWSYLSLLNQMYRDIDP